MIKQYGADLLDFILSDSPPEKDIQWSDTGVSSSNKFLQKIWNLNYLISQKKNAKAVANSEKSFTTKINSFANKIDNSIKNFRFNVAIALFYEVYKIFKDELDSDLEKNTLVKNISVIMKLMLPFVPHLANECLELHGCKTVNQWPSINKNIGSEIIKFAVQINGKTRDIIEIEANLSEAQINNIVNKSSKAKKYLLDKKIIKTIFINNKIINYIV